MSSSSDVCKSLPSIPDWRGIHLDSSQEEYTCHCVSVIQFYKICNGYQSSSSVRSACASSFSMSSLGLKKSLFKKRNCSKTDPPGHECGDSGPDPLVGVDSPVKPHGWSIPTPTLANLPSIFTYLTWNLEVQQWTFGTFSVVVSIKRQTSNSGAWNLRWDLEDTHIYSFEGFADGLSGNPVVGRLQVIPVTVRTIITLVDPPVYHLYMSSMGW